MEQILSAISRELSSSRHAQLKASVDQAAEFLRKNDESMLRDPPYMLRAKCTEIFKDTLKLGSGKVSSLTAQGLQKLLREDRFADAKRDLQEEEELLGFRMPSQIVSCLSGGVITSQPPDVQRDLMKILLCLACEYPWALTYRVLTEEYALCLSAYAAMPAGSGGSNSSATAGSRMQVRTGAQTAFCHSLRAFAQCLGDQWQATKNKTPPTNQQCPLLDIVPLLKFLSLKIKEHLEKWKTSRKKPNPDEPKDPSNDKNLDNSTDEDFGEAPLNPSDAVVFTLAALEALLDAVDPDITVQCPVFIQVLWQHTCPILIGSLGTPLEDVGVGAMRFFGGSDGHGSAVVADGNFGQGSGGWGSKSIRKEGGQHAKTVYNIALRLIVLVGSFRAMRPVLESLFHRMLLYPAPSQRMEPIKAVKDLVKDPSSLLPFAGPTLTEEDVTSGKETRKETPEPSGDDLSLLLMAVHAADEMSAKCPSLASPAVDFVSALLSSLEILSAPEEPRSSLPASKKGKMSIPDVYVEKINELFSTLASADYKGPLTYEKWAATRTNPDGANESSLDTTSCASSESYDEDADIEASEESNEDAGSSVGEERPNEELPAEDDEYAEEDSRQKSRLQALQCRRDTLIRGRRPVDFYHESERRNARRFVQRVGSELMPTVASLRTGIEVDEAVQKFASEYATSAGDPAKNGGGENEKAILNADGVYLAIFSCLSLSLKLSICGFYKGETLKVPLTEDQFVDEVQCNGGVLVYLSSTWLAELYQLTLTTDFFGGSSANDLMAGGTALVALLTDLDGLGSHEVGSQMLSDFRKLVKNRGYFSRTMTPAQEAGMKLSRRILTGCWPSVLSILSRGVGSDVEVSKGSGSKKRLNGRTRAQEVVGKLKSNLEKLAVRGSRGFDDKTLVAALEGLQCSARLCNILGFQAECGAIFDLLAAASCSAGSDANSGIFSRIFRRSISKKSSNKSSEISADHSDENQSSFGSSSSKSKPLADLDSAQMLSIEVMLTKGLELGSHCPDCWPHLFRCVLYVNELESKQFMVQAGVDNKNGDALDEENGYLALPAISLPVGSSTDGTNVTSLAPLVERLFTDAASKLNLKSFREFLIALVAASRKQLFPRNDLANKPRKKNAALALMSGKSGKSQNGCRSPMLIHSLSDVVLKAVKTGRPLVHIMKAWSIAGPHFMEAACHSDPDVAKGAISSIHNIVSMLLSQQSELPAFHFQEALFKPFENLLQLELIETHIQDQIVSSICEFLECYDAEIRSGWRPLFGALRAVRPEASPSSGLARVLSDVFAAFFSSESPQVIANALLDCNLCLLKHVTQICDGEGEEQDGFSALGYLKRSSDCLATFRAMACPPTFHAAHRVKAPSVPKLISTVVEYRDAEIFRPLDVDFPADVAVGDDVEHVSDEEGSQNERRRHNSRCAEHFEDYKAFSDDESLNKRTGKLLACFVSGCGDGVTLESLDDGSGLYHIWYALVEGMMGTVPRCSKRMQSKVLFTLFEILEEIYEIDDQRPFALYCVNHLVLPWCQDWLRRHSPPVIPPPPSLTPKPEEENAVTNGEEQEDEDGFFFPMTAEAVFLSQFKTCCGLLTDLVAGYIKSSSNMKSLGEHEDERNHVNKPLAVLLNQTLVLLIELCNHPKEGVARIGCACFRHLLETCGTHFNRRHWDLAIAALFRAMALTVRPLVTMIRAFKPASAAFYGDIGQIKVMARRDASLGENAQLRRLTAQVFLLESQMAAEDVEDLWPTSSSLSSSDSSSFPALKPTPTKKTGPPVQVDDGSEDHERSYVFLLCPPCTASCCSGSNNANKGKGHSLDRSKSLQQEPDVVGVVRVPFSHVVVGLVAHQLLLQNLARLLLAGSSRVVPSLANVCLSDIDHLHQSWTARSELDEGNKQFMPGFLPLLAEIEIDALAEALRCSQAVAMAFDNRPGLKFLLQKVGGLRVASNLYRQTGAAWTVRFSLAVERFLAVVMNSKTNNEITPAIAEIRAILRIDAKRANTIVNEEENDQLQASSLPVGAKAVIFAVRDALKSAVEAYVDLLGADRSEDDEDGEGRASKTGIFFLASKPGDLPVLTTLAKPRKNVEDLENTEDCYKTAPSSQKSSPKREIAVLQEEQEERGATPDKVYDVVTSEDIENLRKAYAKRKMAWSFQSRTDSKSSLDSCGIARSSGRLSPGVDEHRVSREIRDERETSIQKDGEAKMMVWTEMLTSAFDLLQQVTDEEFCALLPCVFPSVLALLSHATDVDLRQTVADLMQRVSNVYGFSPDS